MTTKPDLEKIDLKAISIEDPDKKTYINFDENLYEEVKPLVLFKSDANMFKNIENKLLKFSFKMEQEHKLDQLLSFLEKICDEPFLKNLKEYYK